MAVVQHFHMKSAPPHRISLSAPDIQAEDVELVVRVLRSNRLSIGPYINQLERDFADYIGTKYAVAVTNGTSGLHLCMRAAGLAEGDEVITTPFSFNASARWQPLERAAPVYVGIDEASLNIDPALSLARGRSTNPLQASGPCRRRSVRCTNCSGLPRSQSGAGRGCLRGRRRRVQRAQGRHVRQGGGVLVLPEQGDDARRRRGRHHRRPALRRAMQSLRNQGRSDGGTGYSSDRLGYNYRLDEMSARLG